MTYWRWIIAPLLLATAAVAVALTEGPMSVLRICADPNNLPFSNDRQEGFENRLASLLAADQNATIEYTWWPQRRGFLRSTLEAGRCDLIMGMPQADSRALTTRPYYRSAYVFVSRSSRREVLHSFDDDRLRTLKIGVQLIGDDFASSPPAFALSARGITDNVVGYSVLGDYSMANPPARIIDAVASGEVDTAIVWGPLAGYFAKRTKVPLRLDRIEPDMRSKLPLAFDISMAVRLHDNARARLLDDFLARRRTAIDTILQQFDIPTSHSSSARGPS